MDSMSEINAPWTEAEDLSLPANHPGLADTGYVRRRKMFFYLARDLRLRAFATPQLAYTTAEQSLWCHLFTELDALHQKHAAEIFLNGKHALGLCAGGIPQLQELEKNLLASTGVKLVPAEGLLHGKTYFKYWSQRTMPCTLFLRHESCPEYTPEPDIVHDVIGHVPPLMNQTYATLIELIGKASLSLHPAELEALVRFYWFSVEFGLIEENGKMKVLGAGILSSIGEMKNVVEGRAELRPFDLEEILATAFDPTHLQPKLFVAPSLASILDSAREVLRMLGSNN